ncbi:hypothetical protein ABZP36_022326 [Zizania latifolia]
MQLILLIPSSMHHITHLYWPKIEGFKFKHATNHLRYTIPYTHNHEPPMTCLYDQSVQINEDICGPYRSIFLWADSHGTTLFTRLTTSLPPQGMPWAQVPDS